ncbi:MAG: RIP metalloprotease RseP [Planctomycetes bacterium]|nr:RIP metalloprotease RseP [Planctomycetota bacterium]MBL7008870.1 RIP metalloprotease RseP [Planctomycetota bacterium]
MLATLLTVFGIGLVLFVHEAGHFLAARAAGVRVEVFSLGFGPRLFGWRRGETDYRLSLLPLGGYVRMAGEEQTRPPLRDELGAQPPGWRFLIFSGGILMNFAFALVVIPVLFAIGVPFEAPVVGTVRPGSPAWQAGVREGERILEVNDQPIHAFRAFSAAVALGDAGEVRMTLQAADGARRELSLEPLFDDQLGFRRIGISPSHWAPDLVLGVMPGSVAELAGLLDGDRLIEVGGLPLATRLDARLLLERAVLGSGPLQLAVERDGQRLDFSLPRGEPQAVDAVQIGILHLLNQVMEVRDPRLAEFLQPGDLVVRANGEEVRSIAEMAAAVLRLGGRLRLEVQRGGERLEHDFGSGFVPGDLVAGLWLDGGEAVRVGVRPDGPASGTGLQTGDRILRANGGEVPDMAALAQAVRGAGADPVSLLVSRPGLEDPFAVTILPRRMPRPDFGFALRADREIVRSDGPLEALSMGFREANQMVREIGGTFRGMLSGAVDSKNLGGILTIGTITHSFASEGLAPLFFFLAMISIHLGVLNLLPIPALDGGHMLFVLVEKLRGRPLSPSTQGWFNVAGLVAVFSLIIFVTMNDLDRFFG